MMEKNRFFLWINRINALLFLAGLIGVLVLIVVTSIGSNARVNRRTVAVSENPNETETAKIELVLDNVEEIEGHNAQYVVLSSKRQGGKFSSGYKGGEKRNVLFLVGDTLETRWLFPDHANFISRMTRMDWEQEETKKTVVFYYEIINEDTNKNGEFDENDLSSLALSRPDGSGLTVVEKGVRSVIDWKLSDEGKTLLLLFQKEGEVYLKKFDVGNFEPVSSKVILQIEG